MSGFLKCVDSLGYLLKKSRPNRYYATLAGCGAGQRRQGFPIDQGVSGCSRSDSDQGRPARRGLAATGVAGGRVGPRRAQRVYISLGKRGDKILGLSYRGVLAGRESRRAPRRDSRLKSVWEKEVSTLSDERRDFIRGVRGDKRARTIYIKQFLPTLM